MAFRQWHIMSNLYSLSLSRSVLGSARLHVYADVKAIWDGYVVVGFLLGAAGKGQLLPRPSQYT